MPSQISGGNGPQTVEGALLVKETSASLFVMFSLPSVPRFWLSAGRQQAVASVRSWEAVPRPPWHCRSELTCGVANLHNFIWLGVIHCRKLVRVFLNGYVSVSEVEGISGRESGPVI